MHYVGWMVAIMAVSLLLGPDTQWPVVVLVAGSISILVVLRGSLSSLPRPARLSGPRSVDAEALHIRELQESIDERTPPMKEGGHER